LRPAPRYLKEVIKMIKKLKEQLKKLQEREKKIYKAQNKICDEIRRVEGKIATTLIKASDIKVGDVVAWVDDIRLRYGRVSRIDYDHWLSPRKVVYQLVGVKKRTLEEYDTNSYIRPRKRSDLKRIMTAADRAAKREEIEKAELEEEKNPEPKVKKPKKKRLTAEEKFSKIKEA